MMDITLDVNMIETILSYELMQTVVGFGFFVIIILLIVGFVQPTKSKRYRRVLADLYVAGKIKKFAIEDGITLADEELDFHKWDKKQRLTDTSLDNVVESELNERISDSVLKKILKKEISTVPKDKKKK